MMSTADDMLPAAPFLRFYNERKENIKHISGGGRATFQTKKCPQFFLSFYSESHAMTGNNGASGPGKTNSSTFCQLDRNPQ